MIWFDLVTPKSVMFFKEIIAEIQNRNLEVLVTTRGGEDYSEILELLKLYEIDHVSIGAFGGGNLKSKLQASLERQFHFMEFIAEYDVQALVSLCSVDANRIAFGLGIPIINFYDIPLSDYRTDFKKALPQARLTLPLSTHIIKPFVVPDEIFVRFSVEADQISEYSFIDPLIWLRDFVPSMEYVKKILCRFPVNYDKPIIVVREEEFKASYVSKKYPFLYEALPVIYQKTGANIVIIPRYESEKLKAEFPYCFVLDEKVVIQHLLAYADLFIGGGGTLNSESCYFGTPTLSTRSFISHYDKFQIDTGLMEWVSGKDELILKALTMLSQRSDERAKAVFDAMNVDVKMIVDRILEL